MNSDFRKVITEKGVFYYRIEPDTIYDYLYLYKKVKYKKRRHFFSKEVEVFEYEQVHNPSLRGGYFWLEQKGDRVENIKECINKALQRIDEFDPDWDGIMIEDKKIMRDMLIDDILEDDN